MIRLKQWLAIPILVAAMILTAHGQSLREWLERNAGGTPPANGILDESRILGRDPERVKRISEAIRKLTTDRGYKIYVVVEPVLIGTTAQEQATELRRKWLPDGDGVVIVFEADSRTLGIGQDLLENPERPVLPQRVPSYETTAIISRALTAVDGKLDGENYLETAVTKLAAEFEAYFIRLNEPPPKERSVRIVLLVVGGLALLCLGLIGAGALVRYSSMARVRSYRFPVVDRPERLGAPLRRQRHRASLRPVGITHAILRAGLKNGRDFSPQKSGEWEANEIGHETLENLFMVNHSRPILADRPECRVGASESTSTAQRHPHGRRQFDP